MYAETGMFFPYMQNFSPEIQLLCEDFCKSPKPNNPMTSSISEYDLGGEGDLFKAPEPIIEEPILAIDPMTAAIAMISCGEDVITPQGPTVTNLESIQNEQQLLNEAFYECEKDLMLKSVMESPLSDILDIKNIPLVAKTDDERNHIPENEAIPDLPFPKSGSSNNLSLMEWVNGATMTLNFLDFPPIDFGAANGMRRAFSEGDIQNLGNGNTTSSVHSPLDWIIGNCTSEDRRQKLSRYRNKKTKRNFGRKIKYACRKALADSQPRIRGRFAKTEEPDVLKTAVTVDRS